MPRSIAAINLPLSTLSLTPRLVFAGASLFLLITVTVTALQFSQAENGVLPTGSTIGGDFVAFFGAAHGAAAGQAADIYDQETFETLLLEIAPPNESYGLSWQYPPTFYLVVLPLVFAAYMPGYVIAIALTGVLFFAALRNTGASWLALLVVAASPTVFHNVIDGQNGFLTAALLTLAALYPDKRPIVAGLAAAALTVKPQLGLLIPIAYMAGGHWRAFGVAALSALGLAGASVAAFGFDSWIAFQSGAGGAWENILNGMLPIYKMTTPLSASLLIGAPLFAAIAVHLMFVTVTMAVVALIWRRARDPAWRTATLCAGVFFVAPYGYLYELTILAAPLLIVAQRGLERGWLPYEQLTLIAAFILPTLARGDVRMSGISWGFVTVLIVTGAVLRRIRFEHPNLFSFTRQRPSGAPA